MPTHGRSRRVVLLFRAFTALGLVLLMLGAACIVAGYVWPHKMQSVTLKRHQLLQDDNGDWVIGVDIIRQFPEDRMKPWKLAGLITFAVGGLILTVSLLGFFGNFTQKRDLCLIFRYLY